MLPGLIEKPVGRGNRFGFCVLGLSESIRALAGEMSSRHAWSLFPDVDLVQSSPTSGRKTACGSIAKL